MKYVAFLRGINVGGNTKISMSELKAALGKKFGDVKTLLNSGNVVFTSEEGSPKKVQEEVEAIIKKTFGLDIHTIIRTQKQLEVLIASDPFKGITVHDKIRLYITFLSGKSDHNLKIPYESEEKDFTIIQVTGGEIISMLDLSKEKGTPDVMGILEKTFGKQITTRNWNTVVKVAAL